MVDGIVERRFSVVVPSFNTATYLRETLESVVSQDYPDFEVIVTDGGSTDGTKAILEEYGDRIRWISEPDKGQSDALNKGFAMATGGLHYWVNADDPIRPGTLSHAAEKLTDASEPQWVVGAADLIDERGRIIATRTVDRVEDATFLLWAMRWIPSQSIAWTRPMWQMAGPVDQDLHFVMDFALWERMHRVAPAIVTDRVMGQYRMHDVSKSLSAIESSRAERKRKLSDILVTDLRAAADDAEALDAKAKELAHLIDELSDQAAFLRRLKEHRLMGPIVRAFVNRVPWSPPDDF